MYPVSLFSRVRKIEKSYSSLIMSARLFFRLSDGASWLQLDRSSGNFMLTSFLKMYVEFKFCWSTTKIEDILLEDLGTVVTLPCRICGKKKFKMKALKIEMYFMLHTFCKTFCLLNNLQLQHSPMTRNRLQSLRLSLRVINKNLKIMNDNA